MTLEEHLKSRHMSLEYYTHWLNYDECLVQFALWNLCGQMIGYHKYRRYGDKSLPNDPWQGKYFSRFRHGFVGVWGMETWNFSNVLFVTEGIFDAARLSSHGVSAVATLSNNPKHLSNMFKLFRSFRPVVAVCDRDDAGAMLSKFGNVAYVVQDAKDLGDTSEDEVKYVLNKFT